MPFPKSPYSPEFLTSVPRTITNERLQRYLLATNQNLANALILYEFNVLLSENMYGLLHGLEVAVRNSMNDALTKAYVTPEWYDHAPLSTYWKDQVSNAKDKVRTTTGDVAPGKIIAELTFGFWVDLISQPNHNILWMGKKLLKAFPNTNNKRNVIHRRLKDLQILRNRISHHERIVTSGQRIYTGYSELTLPQILECVEWVCPHMANWMKTRYRYPIAARVLDEVRATGVHL
jgi:hypothetical protein